jgi:hypothetical protein
VTPLKIGSPELQQFALLNLGDSTGQAYFRKLVEAERRSRFNGLQGASMLVVLIG